MFVFGLLLSQYAATAPIPAQKADIVFKNGLIYTVNPQQPWAQAVAISSQNIVYVGDDKTVTSFIGPKTNVIDMQQKLMLPGLHDNHIHPALGVFFENHLVNIKATSKQDMLNKLALAAKQHQNKGWIVAYGLDSTDSPDFISEKINKHDLDSIAPDKIVVILSRDAHTAWLNSRALDYFHITKDTPDPETGKIVREMKTGEPLGGLVDKPSINVLKQVLESSPYAIKMPDLLKEAIVRLNKLGITSFVDALGYDDIIKGYHDLETQHQLTARVGIASVVTAPDFEQTIPHFAQMREQYTVTDKLYPRWIKVIVDGNPDDHLSYLLKPYNDVNQVGHSYWRPKTHNAMVALASRLGMTTYSHVIGDGAVHEALDAIEASQQTSNKQGLRHVLTHDFMVSPSDLPRFNKLHVIADIQEGWLAPAYSGGAPGSNATKYLIPFLGKERAYRTLPFRALFDANATLTGGSDWYYTNLNPWENIYTGLTSKDPHIPSEAMLPTHTLTVPTLIKMHTINGAFLMYQEKITGSIEVGKRADLIILNQNIFKIPVEDIRKTSVLLTLFDGKILYNNYRTARVSKGYDSEPRA